MSVARDYACALQLSLFGLAVKALLDRRLESAVRSLQLAWVPVNGWHLVHAAVSIVALLVAPPCLAYALLLATGGDLSSAICLTLPTFWTCGKVCGSLVGSSAVVDRVRAVLGVSMVASGGSSDVRQVEVRAAL
jgi:hypothetical protein